MWVIYLQYNTILLDILGLKLRIYAFSLQTFAECPWSDSLRVSSIPTTLSSKNLADQEQKAKSKRSHNGKSHVENAACIHINPQKNLILHWEIRIVRSTLNELWETIRTQALQHCFINFPTLLKLSFVAEQHDHIGLRQSLLKTFSSKSKKHSTSLSGKNKQSHLKTVILK